MNSLQQIAETVESGENVLRSHGIDLTKSGYRRGWKMLAAASSGMGVKVDTHDIMHWAAGFGVMRAADTLVDDHSIADISEYIHEATKGHEIPSMTATETAMLSEVWSMYSAERQNRQFADICSLATHAAERKMLQSTPKYRKSIDDEADMFGRVSAISNFSSHSNEPAVRRFDEWLPTFMRVGYYFDTFQDLAEDFNNERSQIAPTIKNSVYFAGHTALEGVRLMIGTPLKAATPVLDSARAYI